MITETAQMPTFADLLHRLMQEKNVKLHELAEKTGIKYKTMASYVTVGESKRRPSLKNLRKIATALGVTQADLMACKEFQED